MMQPFFIIFLSLFSLLSDVAAQSVPNYNFYKKMTPSELQTYRQSIWDSLPAIGWVNDFEGLFTTNEEDSLESMLQHFEKETSVEIAIVTVDSNMVQKERFNDLSDHLLKIWGIGKFAKKNGIVICISRQYRKLFISTGVGIATFMDDSEKYRIISATFIPPFNQYEYFQGTLSGLSELMNKVAKKKRRFVK